jgi:hypothetical protein
MKYTNEEYADMQLILGEARGNSAEVERLYTERFSNRRTPSRPTFLAVDQRLRETGTFQGNVPASARYRSAPTAVADRTSLMW